MQRMVKVNSERKLNGDEILCVAATSKRYGFSQGPVRTPSAREALIQFRPFGGNLSGGERQVSLRGHRNGRLTFAR